MSSFHGSRHLLAHIMMARTPVLKKYDFWVDWSDEDQCWIGTEESAPVFQHLSWTANSYDEALRGIQNLVCEAHAWLIGSFMDH